MKDQITIDGVRFTREQIEQAEREINTPEFKGGDRVKGIDGYPPEGVVLCPGPSDLIREGWRHPERDIVFAGSDGMVYVYPPEDLIKVED